MTDSRFDWYTFVQKANIEYGTTDADWDPYARVAILSFNEDRNRVCAKFNGKNVYPHNMFKDRIKNGDVWVCSLTINGNTNYFARGIKKLDASFLMELNKGDIDTVVDFLWENNRASLEPVLEEKYKSIFQEKITELVNEARKEDLLKIEELETELERLKKVSSEDKASIKSLEGALEAAKSSNASFAPQQGPMLPPSSNFVPWGISDNMAPVVRISPEAITSENFTRSRYSVHLSADHHNLLIVADANGNVLCIQNTLTLSGLDTILPFSGETELPCTYSPSFNGLIVTLN